MAYFTYKVKCADIELLFDRNCCLILATGNGKTLLLSNPDPPS